MRAIIDIRRHRVFCTSCTRWRSRELEWRLRITRKVDYPKHHAVLRARGSALMTSIRARLRGKPRIDRHSAVDHTLQMWLASISWGILISGSSSLISARCREHVKLPRAGRQKEQPATDSHWPCVFCSIPSNAEFNARPDRTRAAN